MLERIKNLEILEKPEITFKRQLMKNPFYPFEKTEENRKSCHKTTQCLEASSDIQTRKILSVSRF